VFRLALVPLYIAAVVVLMTAAALIFIRIAGGRYAERVIARAACVRPLRRLVIRSYIRELAKTDPVAARAYEKMERVTGDTSGSHSARALAVLTPAERRAYLSLFHEPDAPRNRAERRRTPSGREGGRSRPPRSV
jgi:hypothetical protein